VLPFLAAQYKNSIRTLSLYDKKLSILPVVPIKQLYSSNFDNALKKREENRLP
jgi:hypothetical protein